MRLGFDPWVGKTLWRRAQPCTPVFLPGESHAQRSLVGYGPQGRRVGHGWSDLARTCTLCFAGYSPSWPGKSPLRFALLFVFCSASCAEFLASLEYIQTHLREKHEGILQKERFSKGWLDNHYCNTALGKSPCLSGAWSRENGGEHPERQHWGVTHTVCPFGIRTSPSPSGQITDSTELQMPNGLDPTSVPLTQV